MNKPTILELRRIINTTDDHGINEPAHSSEDYETNHRPRFAKWLAQYGWEEEEYFDALSQSIDEDGMWNPDTQQFDN